MRAEIEATGAAARAPLEAWQRIDLLPYPLRLEQRKQQSRGDLSPADQLVAELPRLADELVERPPELLAIVEQQDGGLGHVAQERRLWVCQVRSIELQTLKSRAQSQALHFLFPQRAHMRETGRTVDRLQHLKHAGRRGQSERLHRPNLEARDGPDGALRRGIEESQRVDFRSYELDAHRPFRLRWVEVYDTSAPAEFAGYLHDFGRHVSQRLPFRGDGGDRDRVPHRESLRQRQKRSRFLQRLQERASRSDDHGRPSTRQGLERGLALLDEAGLSSGALVGKRFEGRERKDLDSRPQPILELVGPARRLLRIGGNEQELAGLAGVGARLEDGGQCGKTGFRRPMHGSRAGRLKSIQHAAYGRRLGQMIDQRVQIRRYARHGRSPSDLAASLRQLSARSAGRARCRGRYRGSLPSTILSRSRRLPSHRPPIRSLADHPFPRR